MTRRSSFGCPTVMAFDYGRREVNMRTVWQSEPSVITIKWNTWQAREDRKQNNLKRQTLTSFYTSPKVSRRITEMLPSGSYLAGKKGQVAQLQKLPLLRGWATRSLLRGHWENRESLGEGKLIHFVLCKMLFSSVTLIHWSVRPFDLDP